jgi:peptide/nickel transport system ATP-binding protein
MNEGSSGERAKIVIDVEHLSIAYETRKGDVEAARDVTFTVREGETVGLVGESGCGKSTIAYGIVNHLGPNGKITGGHIRFQGTEIVGKSASELRKLRGDRIAMVFQDPMQALNPSVRLGEQLAEVLTCHRSLSHQDAWSQAIEMLKRVNMPDPEDIMRRYSHQISGGQQQRVVIAMAMLNNPALLIMDEPTTALDVTVEAAVLDLIDALKSDFHAANIFITHNLGVVARVSDHLCVMYAGQLVEKGPAVDIFKRPCHPYTRGLMAAVPKLGDSKLDSMLYPIRGRVPAPADRPRNACVFAPRCDYAAERCREARPTMVSISRDHSARCFYAEEIEQRSKTSRQRARRFPQSGQRPPETEDTALLEFEHLKLYYPTASQSVVSLFGLGEKRFVKAVDDVSLRLAKGRTLGVVGESGCGKSSLVKGLIGLEPLTDGNLNFLDIEVRDEVTHRSTDLIKEMQMVFQNPDSTLNPSYTVGKQIARPIQRFKTVPKRQVKQEVIRLLKAVRLGAAYYGRLPRQLSGGEKQRVGIARALASRPDLIICDEPVSALDVSVQAAVINLLLEIQQTFGASMIFIAHDLSVVRYFSDDIAVMYLGKVVEIGPAERIYEPPYHPYTEALLAAVPIADPEAEQKEIRLSGNVPSALHPPKGCHFHTRCPRRKEMLPDGGSICESETPPWRQSDAGHRILCHIPLTDLEKIEPVVH